ncbi:PfkB family carbohydrate kinase [Pantoea sp. Mb-10]|uniref:PfkB family carbohydrate kinase n=1 Tax=unclassified Pantoea TaxID=2630326 RepID=UPI001E584EB5|nr:MULTISPECIES: PfkB family carbohydrate kinase [unclassified Pantoea]MCE0490822.1 PfkB family carbohydrate kinase [Pantoea sp. Mb-10]MCE0500020.1 PfkB family carbohydrate kinase [Pantoea sp. Pb-8]
MTKIAVMGSLHYDILLDADHRPEKGETVMGTDCRYAFGGKGGNQALALAKAGAEVMFAGAVGNDAPGHYLREVLRAAKVDTRYIQTIDNVASGMSVAITDAEGDYGAVVVSNANQHIAPEMFDAAPFWHGVSLLVLQNEVPDAINLHAATCAKQQSVQVCLNAAPARPLSAALTALIDVLVVNAIEARDMSDVAVNDLATAARAAQVLSAHFPRVVVTAGEHGVAFCETGHPCQTLAAQKVVLISTHGAGDCFTGTLCAALARQEAFSDAVITANAAAAQHVSQRPGSH